MPLIENNKIDTAFTKIKKVIDSVIGEIDAVILGCTHYTILKNRLKDEYSEIRIISQDEIIPNKLKLYLEKHEEIRKQLSTGGSVEIVLSRESQRYSHIIKEVLD